MARPCSASLSASLCQPGNAGHPALQNSQLGTADRAALHCRRNGCTNAECARGVSQGAATAPLQIWFSVRPLWQKQNPTATVQGKGRLCRGVPAIQTEPGPDRAARCSSCLPARIYNCFC